MKTYFYYKDLSFFQMMYYTVPLNSQYTSSNVR